jgi:hypothetical protein
MKRVLLVAATLVLGCSAGMGGPAEAPAGPALVQTDVSQLAAGEGSVHFEMHMLAGKGIDVLVSDRSLTGTELSVTRYTDASDHAIRGSAFNRIVDVNVDVNGAKGLLGGGALDVNVALVGDELQVRGAVSGQTTAFSMSPRELTGNVGRCMFQMARQGTQYVGTRGCGAQKDAVELTFPASFGAWSQSELGAALVILLTSGM